VILTALNFIAVVLFVPETRYHRDEARPDERGEKNTHTDTKSLRRSSDEGTPQLPKKTFVQELSLWSGTSKTNLFKMFIRYAGIGR
jgi:hypothetical protein